jgi:hypothetical protein
MASFWAAVAGRRGRSKERRSGKSCMVASAGAGEGAGRGGKKGGGGGRRIIR